jgi:hypothetical protein
VNGQLIEKSLCALADFKYQYDQEDFTCILVLLFFINELKLSNVFCYFIDSLTKQLINKNNINKRNNYKVT